MMSSADRSKAADVLINAEKERKQAVQLTKTWPDITMEDAYAIQTEKHCRAPYSSWWLAGQDASRIGRGRRRNRENRRRASQGEGVARKSGRNNAAGTLSRKHGKGQQSYRSEPDFAKTVGRAREVPAAINRRPRS